MDNIKLSAEGKKEMKAFYLEELSKTVQRLKHINSVLEELGESVTEIQLADLAVSRRSSSSTSKRSVSSTPKRKYRKKRGPKSKWDKAILKTIKKASKPLTYDQITDFLMISEGRSPSERKNMKASVQNTVFRMRKDKKVSTFGVGSRTKFIAPMDWFEKDGSIKTEFKDKIPAPVKKANKPKAQKAKRPVGRPRKATPKAAAKPKAKKATAKKVSAKKATAKKASAKKPAAKKVAAKKAPAKKASPAKKKASAAKPAPKKAAAKEAPAKKAPAKKVAAKKAPAKKASPTKKKTAAPKRSSAKAKPRATKGKVKVAMKKSVK